MDIIQVISTLECTVAKSQVQLQVILQNNDGISPTGGTMATEYI